MARARFVLEMVDGPHSAHTPSKQKNTHRIIQLAGVTRGGMGLHVLHACYPFDSAAHLPELLAPAISDPKRPVPTGRHTLDRRHHMRRVVAHREEAPSQVA